MRLNENWITQGWKVLLGIQVPNRTFDLNDWESSQTWITQLISRSINYIDIFVKFFLLQANMNKHHPNKVMRKTHLLCESFWEVIQELD